MKRRTTKNKILDHLTKLVDAEHLVMQRCARLKLHNAHSVARMRYNTLIEVRSYINDHRI